MNRADGLGWSFIRFSQDSDFLFVKYCWGHFLHLPFTAGDLLDSLPLRSTPFGTDFTLDMSPCDNLCFLFALL
jgi:hypothetical protein